MTILALDACGRYAIAALKRGDETLYAVSDAGVGAVRAVYSSVDRVLAHAGIGAAEIDAIVVNTGPGSWTGVRVSVTYTAGLAFAAGKRVYGYSGFAIGKHLGGVAFIDQLGKTVAEEGAGGAAHSVPLFAEIDADTYLLQRRAWLNQMLVMGADALAAGEAGDPLELKTTYFQEFLAGVRK